LAEFKQHSTVQLKAYHFPFIVVSENGCQYDWRNGPSEQITEQMMVMEEDLEEKNL